MEKVIKVFLIIPVMLLALTMLYSEEVYVKLVDWEPAPIIVSEYASAYVERQDNKDVIAVLFPLNLLESIKDSLLINTYHPDKAEIGEHFVLNLRNYEIKDEMHLMPRMNLDFEIVPHERFISNNGKKVEVFNTKKGTFMVPYYFCDELVFYDHSIYHLNSILEKARTDNPKDQRLRHKK